MFEISRNKRYDEAQTTTTVVSLGTKSSGGPIKLYA